MLIVSQVVFLFLVPLNPAMHPAVIFLLDKSHGHKDLFPGSKRHKKKPKKKERERERRFLLVSLEFNKLQSLYCRLTSVPALRNG